MNALGQIKVYIHTPGALCCALLNHCSITQILNTNSQTFRHPTAATIITTTTTATITTESTVAPGSTFTSSTGSKSSESLLVFRTPKNPHSPKSREEPSAAAEKTLQLYYPACQKTWPPKISIVRQLMEHRSQSMGPGFLRVEGEQKQNIVARGEKYRFTGRGASIGGNEYAKHQARIWDMQPLQRTAWACRTQRCAAECYNKIKQDHVHETSHRPKAPDCCLDKDGVKSLSYIQWDDRSATLTHTFIVECKDCFLLSFVSEQGRCCNWKRMASAKLALLGPAQVSKIRWMQSAVWSWSPSLLVCMFCRDTFWESLTIPTMSTICCHVAAPAGTGTGLLSSNLVSHQTASPGTHGTQNHTDDTTLGVAPWKQVIFQIISTSLYSLQDSWYWMGTSWTDMVK